MGISLEVGPVYGEIDVSLTEVQRVTNGLNGLYRLKRLWRLSRANYATSGIKFPKSKVKILGSIGDWVFHGDRVQPRNFRLR